MLGLTVKLKSQSLRETSQFVESSSFGVLRICNLVLRHRYSSFGNIVLTYTAKPWQRIPSCKRWFDWYGNRNSSPRFSHNWVIGFAFENSNWNLVRITCTSSTSKSHSSELSARANGCWDQSYIDRDRISNMCAELESNTCDIRSVGTVFRSARGGGGGLNLLKTI